MALASLDQYPSNLVSPNQDRIKEVAKNQLLVHQPSLTGTKLYESHSILDTVEYNIDKNVEIVGLDGIFQNYEFDGTERSELENRFQKTGRFQIPVDRFVEAHSLDYFDDNPGI